MFTSNHIPRWVQPVGTRGRASDFYFSQEEVLGALPALIEMKKKEEVNVPPQWDFPNQAIFRPGLLAFDECLYQPWAVINPGEWFFAPRWKRGEFFGMGPAYQLEIRVTGGDFLFWFGSRRADVVTKFERWQDLPWYQTWEMKIFAIVGVTTEVIYDVIPHAWGWSGNPFC